MQCEENMEAELKASQKMWHEPDSILNTYIVQVTSCQKLQSGARRNPEKDDRVENQVSVQVGMSKARTLLFLRGVV